jgi:hypothetical protein
MKEETREGRRGGGGREEGGEDHPALCMACESSVTVMVLLLFVSKSTNTCFNVAI